VEKYKKFIYVMKVGNCVNLCKYGSVFDNSL
jgi:hypothetical protein